VELSWKRAAAVVMQAGKDLIRDNGMSWASAVSFYALLSVFPLILVGAYAASLFMAPEVAVDRASDLLGEFIPVGDDEVGEVVQEALNRRGAAGVVSTLALLWSGTRVFGTITLALNIAFDADEVYSFWKRRLAELAMLLTVGVVFLIALLSRPLLGVLRDAFDGLPGGRGIALFLASEVAPVLLLVASFFLLFRFAPRARPSWVAALPGAVVTTALFLVAQALFVEYVFNFSEYNLIYGSVALVVIVMLWVWVATVILLFGGELVAHTQMMVVEGMSAEEVEKRHMERDPRHKSSS
jgi:membrane protein